MFDHDGHFLGTHSLHIEGVEFKVLFATRIHHLQTAQTHEYLLFLRLFRDPDEDEQRSSVLYLSRTYGPVCSLQLRASLSGYS